MNVYIYLFIYICVYIHFALEKEMRKVVILKKHAETLHSIFKWSTNTKANYFDMMAVSNKEKPID